MKAKGVKFLILLILWLFGMVLTLAVVYSTMEHGPTIYTTYDMIHGFYGYADSWNILSLGIILAGLIILFAINGLLTGQYFKKLGRTDLSVRNALIWTAHKVFSLFLVFLEFILITNLLVITYGWMKIHDADEVSEPMAIVVLSNKEQLHSDSGEYVHFEQLTNASWELYEADKARSIYVSGENSHADYNMKNALVQKGIPSDIIALDSARSRTEASFVRFLYNFNEREVLIVAERFQVEMALVLARYYEIDPLGYVSHSSASPLFQGVFVRPRVLMNISLFNTQPYFRLIKERGPLNLQKKSDLMLVVALVCLLVLGTILTVRTLDY